jgi:hypothetical protein
MTTLQTRDEKIKFCPSIHQVRARPGRHYGLMKIWL